MDPLSIAAASGLRSRAETLDMLGNNLANAGTAGFKADHEFYQLYVSAEGSERLHPELPNIAIHWTDHSQGVLNTTGSLSDFGLDGRGFFVVQLNGLEMLTRNGNFQVDNKGILRTSDGYAIERQDGQPVKLDPSLPFDVTRDGAIFQSRQLMGQLRLTDVASPQSLKKQGTSYFQMPMSQELRPATGVAVHQGRLESANVPTADSAVKLVSVMRQFESLQRALTLGNEMNRRAIEDVARVNA